VIVESTVKKDGMVIDFAKLKQIVETEVLEKLDHKQLNDLAENPTAETIVEWIYDHLKDKLPLAAIKLWEGQGKWVEKVVK